MQPRAEATTNRSHTRLCRWSAISLLLLAAALLLVAESLRSATGAYAFKRIVESGGQFERLRPSPAINTAGTVVFEAQLPGDELGMFAVTSSHPSPVTLADTHSYLGYFGSLPTVSEAGTAVFTVGYRRGGPMSECAVSSQGGPITIVAHTSGQHTSTQGGSAGINRDGKVVFFASGDDDFREICIGDDQGGPVTNVADNKGTFYNFGMSPVIDDAGHVVLVGGRRSGDKGIYTVEHIGDPPVLLLADRSRNFLHVDYPTIGDHDQVVFYGVRFDGNDGIYTIKRTGGPITAVVDARRKIYSGFFGLTANAAGKIAFSASRGGSKLGIYTGADPARDHVVVPGDHLFGATIDQAMLAQYGLNQRGEIAFFYALDEERTGIAVAVPSRWGMWTRTVTISITILCTAALLLVVLGYFVTAKSPQVR